MHWRLTLLLVLLLGIVPLVGPGLEAPPVQAADCGFSLGFRTLHDMIPNIVGECRENEWHNAFNGDGLQQTTGGLLVWRKADNWTAFTDGAMTWINGPVGLAARRNDERFPWEGVAEVPAPTAPGGSVPNSDGGQGNQQSSSTTSAPAPSVIIRISDTRPNNQEEFTIRLEASSDIGLDSMWWWATSTDDDDLRDTHAVNCRSSNPCRRSWDVSTKDWGRIIIHAKVRDTSGQESDEVARDVRVREPVPTATPTGAATATVIPTSQPTATPTNQPTAMPTNQPTVAPLSVATAMPTGQPAPTATPALTAIPATSPVSPTTTATATGIPSGACGTVQTLALAPIVGTATVGSPYSVLVTPSDGGGCAGALAMLQVQSGPNTGSPAVIAPIGLDGTITLSYTGANPGADTVLVWLDLTVDGVAGAQEPNALATVTWTTGAAQP